MRTTRGAVRVFVAAGAVLALAVAFAPPASAHLHFMKIRELFGGTGGSPNAQYVELQMYIGGQNFVDGSQVSFYNATGGLQHSEMFSSNVAQGQDDSTILIATQEAEALFGVQADLQLATAAMTAAGGKVCFEDPGGFGVIDCASFGNYTGNHSGSGTPFNAPEGIPAGATMLRDVSGGSNPNELDPGDDTGQSAADFRFAAPSPRNNAGTTGSSPGGVLNFSVADFNVAEDGVSATISVMRAGYDGTTDVDYATVDGTATAHDDYTPATGTLTFSGTDPAESFAISVGDDDSDEDDETVLLRLRNATSNTVLGPRLNATLTILDDEGLPPDDTDPVSRISRPDHGTTYRPGRLLTLRGTAEDASPIAGVEIALRMTRTIGSCRWFNGTRFVERACFNKRWRPATGTDAWSLSLPGRLPESAGTKVKHYTLFSRATDVPGNVEETFEKSRNANRFEIR